MPVTRNDVFKFLEYFLSTKDQIDTIPDPIIQEVGSYSQQTQAFLMGQSFELHSVIGLSMLMGYKLREHIRDLELTEIQGKYKND